MKVSYKPLTASLTRVDLLVVLSREGVKCRLPAGVTLPGNAVESFGGGEREVRLCDATAGPAKQVLQVGLGEGRRLDLDIVRRAAAIAVKKAEKTGAGSVAFWLGLPLGKQAAECGQALAEGVVMGAYRLTNFRSDAKPASLKRTAIHGDKATLSGARRGEAIGAGNCLARRLQDSPANHMRPRDLVAEARALAGGSPRISLRVFDEKQMAKMGMGSLLSVSRGSDEPAYLIHLTYRPAKKARRRICLVGKGLTFDSGGISLKPATTMDEMKYDMSGGAAVLGTFQVLRALQPEVEVHGLIPTSENLPDGKANKPGDVVTACNGTTIEILNTDAEGRLILADALAYAVDKIRPDAMIDLATLTGAVVVALGHEVTGAMGNNDALIAELIASGKTTGEGLWHLPILDAHKKAVQGTIGDLRNKTETSIGAGSSTGGAFLSHFVGEIPWVHLDIAGSAWGAVDRDYQGGKSGTGVGVRLLVDYLEKQQSR